MSVMKRNLIVLLAFVNLLIALPASGGTFTDSSTGLMWDTTTAGPMTWELALEYCDILYLSGYPDWRLPDINELQSLADYGLYDPVSSVSGTQSALYWSSTSSASSNSSAWGVNFKDGDITTGSKTGTYYVRAVRGGTYTPLCTTDNGNGDGTVTDAESGLVWEQVTQGPMTWQAALDYCENLELGGHTDWRMPDVNELQSIVEYTAYDPAISDPECSKYGPFPNTVSNFYWSSTSSASSNSSVWGVNFKDGDITTGTKTGSYYVRAVRGGEYSPLCMEDNGNGDGTVTDPETGRLWAQETVGPMTWQEALSHCDTLSLAGYTDWCMPDINELQSIVEYSAYDPAISDPECSRYGPFPNTVSNFYWSSTSSASSNSSAWGVNFKDGDITTGTKTTQYYVRPVRCAASYMAIHIAPAATAEAPISFEVTADSGPIPMDYYEWYVTGSHLPDAVTMDGYISLSILEEGTYTLRIIGYDIYGRKYETERIITVTAPSTISRSFRFIPHYPADDTVPSPVMKGGRAIRYYRIVGLDNLPIPNEILYYKYADGTRFTTATDNQGFVEIQTPKVLSDNTLGITVTNKDGYALSGITVSDIPQFPVQVTDRELTEEYKLLIGMGATVGIGGPKLTLGPVKFKTVNAGLHGEKNISTSIILNTSGSVTDMDMENTLDMALGVETFAGLSASIMKKKKNAPKLEAGVGVNAYLGTAMSTTHRFEDFFNAGRWDHNAQLFTAAALFFENMLKTDPMYFNNILTNILLEKLIEKIADTERYYQATGLSGSAKIQANLGGELTFGNPFGIMKDTGAGISLKAFDAETVLTLSGGEDVDGVKSLALSLATDIDVGTFSAGLSQNFGDRRYKDRPELSLDFIDKAWKRLEGEMSIGAEIDPYSRWSLFFTLLTDRIGGDMYFLNSTFTENYFSMKVTDNAVLDFMERESALISQVRNGDGFSISETAYLSVLEAFESLSFGRAEWDETAKEIRLFSLPIDFGLGFGLDIDLSFRVDVQSLLEYSKTQGTFVPEKGMVKTAVYERDTEISSQVKGFSAVTDQYVAVINNVLGSILETLENIKEAGKELIVETGEVIAAGGAKIKAGVTSLASGTKLKLTRLLGRDGRSFRIRADARSGESAASTVGDLFLVSLTDDAGNLIEPDAPLELTLGYTEADLNAAGFTLADAALLRIYRRNPDTGYYEAVSSTVNTVAHSVTAMISEMGQYVLAIDGAAPEIADFTFTAGTLTPEITFSLSDTLSGIDLSSVSITLDGNEVIDSSNISEYFNIHSGAFQWTVPENLTSGEHFLRVYAKDTAGNTADKSFAFTINNSPPVITHTPVTQASGGTSLTISAGVTDDQGLQTVLLCYRAKTSELPYILTEMSGTVARTGQYSASIPAAYLTSFGTRYFIRAADISGNVSESEAVDISVTDNAGPQMPGTPVAAPSAEGYRLTWSASPDADVAGYRVYLGGTAQSMTLHEDMGPVTWILLDESRGDDLISVSAYDSTGNEGPKTEAVKVKQCLMADIDCNSRIDLADAVLCLKILSGIPVSSDIFLTADVNSNGKIGMEEVVYILRDVAGMNGK